MTLDKGIKPIVKLDNVKICCAVAAAVVCLASAREAAAQFGGAPQGGTITGNPAPTPPPQMSKPPMMQPNDPNNPLHLTMDQQKKMYAIAQQAYGARNKLAGDQSLSQAQKMSKMQDIQKSMSAQMLKILTPSQRAKETELQAASTRNQAKMAAAMKEFQAVQAKLTKSITPAQKAKVTALQTGFQARVKAIMGNSKLSKAQQTSQLQALRASAISQTNALLTPEQMAELKQMQAIRNKAMGMSTGHP